MWLRYPDVRQLPIAAAGENGVRIRGLILVLFASFAATAVAEVTQVGDKNYAIGEERTVYVGQPMVSAKTFNRSHSTTRREYIASVEPFTFSLSLGGRAFSFNQSSEMRDVGKITHVGKEYTLLQMPERALSNNLLMVDDNLLFVGYVKAPRKVISAGANIFISTRPKQIQFARRTVEEARNSSQFVNNFEILYSGKTKDEINLLYREYTAEDYARPAFTQNLTYEADSKTIRFRDLVMRVIEVNGESIRFVVEADGM